MRRPAPNIARSCAREERFVAWSELRGALNTLEQACDSFDYDAIKRFIERLVEGADLAEQLMDLSGQVALRRSLRCRAVAAQSTVNAQRYVATCPIVTRSARAESAPFNGSE